VLSNIRWCYDQPAQTSGAALAIFARDLRYGCDGIGWRADVFEPCRRAKTGGEENGNDKSISRQLARRDNQTRRIETEADAPAISRYARVRDRAAIQ